MDSNHQDRQRLSRPKWKEAGLRVVLVVIGLGLWFLTQQLVGHRGDVEGDADAVGDMLTRGDALLMGFDGVNRFLHANRPWAHTLLIISSGIIDLLGAFLLLRAIFGPSLRPFLGLLILFTLRQLSQALCILPPPDGIIWEPPGFPSLLVTYSVANDFFFSGHTSIAVYGAVEIARLKGRHWIWLGVAIAVFESATVLMLRAHYTMDVLTGILAALLAAAAASHIAPRVDSWTKRICKPTSPNG